MYQSFVYHGHSEAYRDLAEAVYAEGMHEDHNLVTVSTQQPVTVEFSNMHELIGDILRNHTKTYILVGGHYNKYDELMTEVILENFPLHAVCQWLIAHLSDIKTFRYLFDGNTRTGKYKLSRDMSYTHSHENFCYYLIEKPE